MFRFIAVQRNRNIRLLEKIGEIIQTPKHKSDLKQSPELNLSRTLKTLDRPDRNACAFRKLRLRHVLLNPQHADTLRTLKHDIMRNNQ